MANSVPPVPIQDPAGSFAWLEWYRQLQAYLSTGSSVPWAVIDKAGANITDIPIRAHNTLQSLQGGTSGQYYHMTSAQNTALLAGLLVTITTAKLTLAGVNGSMTFTNGILTAQTPAT